MTHKVCLASKKGCGGPERAVDCPITRRKGYNERMFLRNSLRFCTVVAGLALVAGLLSAVAQQGDSSRGRKVKIPPPAARIEVTVVRDASGKPVESAAVIFHPMEGERDKGAMELKTNEDGKAMIDVIPIGDTVRLQVIAKGFQTYGQDYKIDKSDMSMQVRLKRPGEQYSIYKNNNGSGSSDKGSDKPADGSKSGSSSTPPDGSATQPKQ